MAKKRVIKYYVGMLLKHKKYHFTIRLAHQFSRRMWGFEVIRGSMPKSLFPDWGISTDSIAYDVYSISTLRSNFSIIGNSAAGRILFSST